MLCSVQSVLTDHQLRESPLSDEQTQFVLFKKDFELIFSTPPNGSKNDCPIQTGTFEVTSRLNIKYIRQD